MLHDLEEAHCGHQVTAKFFYGLPLATAHIHTFLLRRFQAAKRQCSNQCRSKIPSRLFIVVRQGCVDAIELLYVVVQVDITG